MRHPRKMILLMFSDLWAGRELAWRLFIRDVSSRYRQTIFGFIWAFLPPIATTATFVILNSGGVINLGNDLDIPYPVYVMIGTLLWQVFVDALNSPLQTVTASKATLVKINLPREAILLSGIYMIGFNFLIRLILLVAVLGWFQYIPPSTIILLPIGVVALVGFGFMIGLAITPIGLLYNDVAQSLPIITSLWLFLTPVVYPPRTEGLLGELAIWNPVSPLILVSRDWLTVGTTDFMAPFWIVVVITSTLLFFGWVLFRLAIPHLIARMGG